MDWGLAPALLSPPASRRILPPSLSRPAMPTRPPLRRARRLVALSLLAVTAACGGGDGDEADSLAAEETAAADTAAAAAAAPAAEAELGAADIDAYERGLAAEVEVLREVVDRRAKARTGEDTLSVMMAATEMQSVPAAAERAGLDVDRYRRLENAFGPVLSARVMNPTLRAQTAQADTSQLAQLPAEAQERARANMREAAAAFSDSATYARLPAALHDAFKQRADARLDALWRERNELRARAAGLGG